MTSADAETPRDAPGAPGVRADSERVVWTLVVRPAEATVSVDGRVTPTRDGVLVLREPRGAMVTVHAEALGRRARTQQVRVLDDDSQVWTLDEVTEPRPPRPAAVVRARVRDDAGVVAADVPAVVDVAAVRVVAPLDGLKTNPYDSGRRP